MDKLKKLWFRRLLLLALLSQTILLCLVTSISSTPTYNWYWSPDIHFTLPTYDTKIMFNTWIYLDSFAWNDAGTQITFTNIKMGNGQTAQTSLSAQNGNITVSKLFDSNRFEYTVSASTDTTSITQVGCTNYGIPDKVMINGQSYSQGTYWTYDDDTKIVTVTWTHTSIASVVLDWAGAESEGSETDPLLQYLIEGDLLGFITACYTRIFGNTIFGLLAFFVGGVLFIRTRSPFLVGLLWVLVGMVFVKLFGLYSSIAVAFLALGFGGLIFGVMFSWGRREG